MQWRNISQEGIDELWKELCFKIQEDVLVKYKVKETKKGAYKGHGEWLTW